MTEDNVEELLNSGQLIVTHQGLSRTARPGVASPKASSSSASSRNARPESFSHGRYGGGYVPPKTAPGRSRGKISSSSSSSLPGSRPYTANTISSGSTTSTTTLYTDAFLEKRIGHSSSMKSRTNNRSRQQQHSHYGFMEGKEELMSNSVEGMGNGLDLRDREVIAREELGMWMDNYKEEKGRFHSVVLHAEVRLEETIRLTLGMGYPNAIRAQIVGELLDNIMDSLPRYKRVLVRIVQDIKAAIFVDPNAESLVPFFSIYDQVSKSNEELNGSTQTLRTDLQRHLRRTDSIKRGWLRSIRRMQNHLIYKSWSTWVTFCTQRYKIKALADVAFIKSNRRNLKRCLEGWKRYILISECDTLLSTISNLEVERDEAKERVALLEAVVDPKIVEDLRVELAKEKEAVASLKKTVEFYMMNDKERRNAQAAKIEVTEEVLQSVFQKILGTARLVSQVIGRLDASIVIPELKLLGDLTDKTRNEIVEIIYKTKPEEVLERWIAHVLGMKVNNIDYSFFKSGEDLLVFVQKLRPNMQVNLDLTGIKEMEVVLQVLKEEFDINVTEEMTKNLLEFNTHAVIAIIAQLFCSEYKMENSTGSLSALASSFSAQIDTFAKRQVTSMETVEETLRSIILASSYTITTYANTLQRFERQSLAARLFTKKMNGFGEKAAVEGALGRNLSSIAIQRVPTTAEEENLERVTKMFGLTSADGLAISNALREAKEHFDPLLKRFGSPGKDYLTTEQFIASTRHFLDVDGAGDSADTLIADFDAMLKEELKVQSIDAKVFPEALIRLAVKTRGKVEAVPTAVQALVDGIKNLMLDVSKAQFMQDVEVKYFLSESRHFFEKIFRHYCELEDHGEEMEMFMTLTGFLKLVSDADAGRELDKKIVTDLFLRSQHIPERVRASIDLEARINLANTETIQCLQDKFYGVCFSEFKELFCACAIQKDGHPYRAPVEQIIAFTNLIVCNLKGKFSKFNLLEYFNVEDYAELGYGKSASGSSAK